MITINLERQQLAPGLYLVAMPIGNAKDIGLRSIEILTSVDVVACEDTRTFQNTIHQVLSHKWNLISHHKNNEQQSAEGILKLIQSGKSVALVSDAGTLNISDPGAKVLRLLLRNHIKITSIPGPSALTTALSMYPILSPISFYGFLPHRTGDKSRLFQSLKTREESLVFYESPHRLIETLETANKEFTSRKVFIAREISKTYEEFFYFSIEEALEHFKTQPPKGEFVLVFSPFENTNSNKAEIIIFIQNLLEKKLSSKDILQEVKKAFNNINRNDVYQWIEDLKQQEET